MKKVIFPLLFLTVILAAQSSKWYDEIQEVNNKIIESIMNKTPETSIDFYMDDVVSLQSYAPMIVGKEVMLKNAEMQQDDEVNWKSFVLTTKYIWESGDFVVEIGNYSYSMEIPGMPGPYTDVGKYMTLFEIQDDGKLKIKADTWNTDLNPWVEMAPPPAPEGDMPPPEDK